MSGPYLSYVLPSFASKPARTLKVCTLKEHLFGLIKIWNIYVTKNIDNINIIIIMSNSNWEPQAFSKAPLMTYFSVSCLFVNLIALETVRTLDFSGYLNLNSMYLLLRFAFWFGLSFVSLLLY